MQGDFSVKLSFYFTSCKLESTPHDYTFIFPTQSGSGSAHGQTHALNFICIIHFSFFQSHSHADDVSEIFESTSMHPLFTNQLASTIIIFIGFYFFYLSIHFSEKIIFIFSKTDF
jgi:hypothetical protein